MIRYLLLLWLTLVSTSWGGDGQKTIYAYYLGQFSPESWQQGILWQSQNENAGDPFAEESESLEDLEKKIIATPALKEVPFESRFFRQGDVLQDWMEFVKACLIHSGVVEQAVWNETSGRLILKGDELVHRYMKNFTLAYHRKQPRMIQLRVKFFETPRKDFTLSHWNEEDLSTQGDLLGEVVLVTNSGQKMISKTGGPVIEVSWEPHVGIDSGAIDARLEFSGKVGSHQFQIVTGFTTFDGLSRCLELGSLTQNGKVLVLGLTQEVMLMGGVLKQDVILDVDGKGEDPIECLRSLFHSQDAIIDPETGKAFRVFSVPPTFLEFLSGGGTDGEEEGDPFAEDDELESKQDSLIAKQTLLKSWDAKVVASVLDRLVDLKKLLWMQGVKLSDSDFAVLNVDSNLVSVETSPSQMELVAAILEAG